MTDVVGKLNSSSPQIIKNDEIGRREDNPIDKKTEELQKSLTSQDKLEKLEAGAPNPPSKARKIFFGILGGVLLAAGLVAAAAATVASLGIGGAVLAGFAAGVTGALGGVTISSIAAGVAGAAGIGCIVSSAVKGKLNSNPQAFAEGARNNNSNDNLDLIRHSNINLNQLDAPKKENKAKSVASILQTFNFYRNTYKELRNFNVIAEEKYSRLFEGTSFAKPMAKFYEELFSKDENITAVKNLIKQTFANNYLNLDKMIDDITSNNNEPLKNMLTVIVTWNDEAFAKLSPDGVPPTDEQFMERFKELVTSQLNVQAQAEPQAE